MYEYHQDAGHGWLKVELSDLNALNVTNKMSKYSYKNGAFAYLEEDVDWGIFEQAAMNRNGGNPLQVKLINDGDRSPIRSFARISD